jgi:hypothetical protein
VRFTKRAKCCSDGGTHQQARLLTRGTRGLILLLDIRPELRVRSLPEAEIPSRSPRGRIRHARARLIRVLANPPLLLQLIRAHDDLVLGQLELPLVDHRAADLTAHALAQVANLVSGDLTGRRVEDGVQLERTSENK